MISRLSAGLLIVALCLTPSTGAAANVIAPPAQQNAGSSASLTFSSGERSVTAVPYPGPSSSAPHAADTTFTPIISEDFEGFWPTAGWQTFDGDNPPTVNGHYCWGKVPFQGYQSTYSAWPAAGCTNGLNPATAPYPALANSWMVFGPFSLVGATSAQVRFQRWQQIVGQVVGNSLVGDSLVWAASTNNINYQGFVTTGSSTTTEPPTSTGWQEITFDLTNVPNLGNLAGQSQVWIAWIFRSDTAQSDNGPFIDNVVIEQSGVTATGTIGGRGFGLTRDAFDPSTLLTWTGGTQQTSYQLARVGLPSGQTTFITLSAGATSYADPVVLNDQAQCYALSPMNQTTSLGISDSLCLVHSRTGSPPSQFTLRMNQSPTASLSWAPPYGFVSFTNYLVIAIPLNGSATRYTTLANTQLTTTDATGGSVTCYTVALMNNTSPLGNADAICAVPNSSTLGASAGGSSVERAAERLRSSGPSVPSQSTHAGGK
jgi:hypothetical protein